MRRAAAPRLGGSRRSASPPTEGPPCAGLAKPPLCRRRPPQGHQVAEAIFVGPGCPTPGLDWFLRI